MDEATEKTIQECLEPLGYKFVKKIGEGSYSNVYMTKFTNKDKAVIPMACKILRTEKLQDDENSMKFVTRELNITLNIYHPDIIHTFSVFQRSSIFMIFMRILSENFPHTDLKEIIKKLGKVILEQSTMSLCSRNAEYGNVTNFLIKHGPVKEKVARFWIRQVASALFYMHELDLIHRDLKCDNLLITINHNVKLADFGFARFTLDNVGKNCKCTTYCGSIPYTAPEILKGQPYDGKPTDVWSLGCILFVMLNKKLPFKDNNNYTKLYQEQINRKYIWNEKLPQGTITLECMDFVGKLLDPVAKTRLTMEQVLDSLWIKMDSRLVRSTEAEKQAMEKAYERKSEIKPYKFIKITSDTKNKLKILSQDQKPWASTKDLKVVAVNNEEDDHSIEGDGGGNEEASDEKSKKAEQRHHEKGRNPSPKA